MSTRRVRRVAFVLVTGLTVMGCIPDGTHVVGPEPGQASPGVYWAAAKPGCVYARTALLPGGQPIERRVAVHHAGVQVVWVHPFDKWFDSRGCGGWLPLTRAPLTDSPVSPKLSEWTYRIGIDMAPGRWTASARDGRWVIYGCGRGGSCGRFENPCRWERLSNFLHDPASTIQRGEHQGATAVRIEPTDAGFSSSGCTNWEYLGP